MSETVLLGRGQQISGVPRQQWEQHIHAAPQHSEHRLSFMSSQHHLVRYFVVQELPRFGEPIPPKHIAQELDIPLGQVQSILNELERNLFFLVRNEAGAVVWAYPVTVAPTPHRITFSTGEEVYAA